MRVLHQGFKPPPRSKFPEYPSEYAVDLLYGLLTKDPAERIGFVGGVDELKSHPFFDNIDWERVEDKYLVPPIKPDLRNDYFVNALIEEDPHRQTEQSQMTSEWTLEP